MSTVFIISAPSGSGKTTLVRRLFAELSGLHFSVSFTTRPPRGGERTGHEYHFISREEFEKRIAKDEFLEYADVFGNYYGSHISELEKARAAGQDLVLDIDVKGAAQLRAKLPDVVSIFILPPSREILEKRLRERSEDPDPVIERRLREAAAEIRKYADYDYVLINRDLDESSRNLSSIVRGERIRRSRMTQAVAPILESFAAEAGPENERLK